MLFLKETIDSNWIAPVGPNIALFTEQLQNYTKSDSIALTSSGTASIHLAMKLLDVEEGDVVLVQSHNHIGSVNPILYQGATPVFIGSEEETWNMSPVWLEKAIKANQNRSIKAIIPVHIYGMPCKLKEIIEIGEKYNIPVVEDAAESLGSTYNDKHTGTFGSMGIYSFNGNKIITTSGGGALTSQKREYIDRANFLAAQAREKEIYFEHKEIGFNYSLSNVLAGIGRAQMNVLQSRVEKRRENFETYKSFFKDWNDKGFNVKFQKEGRGVRSNRWLTAILIDPRENRGITSRYILETLEANNIESRLFWKPMHLQPIFQNHAFFGSHFSDKLFELGLCLPSGSSLETPDFKRIFEVLDEIFSKHI